MSYTNPIESSARKAIAITALNNLRHEIEGRKDKKFTDSNRTLILESISLNESDKLTSKHLIYNFHGVGGLDASPSIQILEAFKENYNGTANEVTPIMILLKNYLSNGAFDSDDAKKEVVKFLEDSINHISANKEDEEANDSLIKMDL